VKRISVALFVMLAACGYENSQVRLRTAIDAQQTRLDACYADLLADVPDAQGMVKMLVTVPVNSNGQITNVEFSPKSQIQDPQLQQCVQRVLVGMPINGAPIQNDLLVEYTLRFEPEA
jgi:hypothetical protein